jgi:uroporphyrinogen decarboxylase
MTSKERVMAAFEHCAPDRVPAWCGSSPEFWEKAKQSTGLQDEELRAGI